MTGRIAAIAEGLARDWWARTPYRTLAGDEALSGLDEAYAVQAALQPLLAERRGPLAGRKIALSSKAMQEMVGVPHPVAGAFFAGDIRRSPATVAASEFRRLGVEFELAVVVARDVAPGEVHDAASVRALVAAVHPAFELVEDRGLDYAELDILTLVADNAWCGGVVLGEAIPLSGRDPGDLPAVVHQDGEAPEETNTGAADPMGSLAWVLNHVTGRGGTVAAGEVVITGSAVRTRFPGVGARLRYEVAGHGVELVVA